MGSIFNTSQVLKFAGERNVIEVREMELRGISGPGEGKHS
jgi:hypothetical protein